MNKTLIVAVVGLVIFGGYFAYSSTQGSAKDAMMKDEMAKDEMMKEDMMKDEMAKDEMMKDEMVKDEMMKDETVKDEMMKKGGSYAVYDAAKLAMAETGKVILFFKASWCPSCRALDADIKANLTNIPADVTILEVDYDASTDLKKKYGVTSQHTLVQVDAKGNTIHKWSGGLTLASVVQNSK